MRQTQKQIIIRYLQEINNWVPSYKLRGMGTPFGFIGHQGDRRCRELANEGKLQNKIEGGFVWYRAIPLVYEPYKLVGINSKIDKIINLA